MRASWALNEMLAVANGESRRHREVIVTRWEYKLLVIPPGNQGAYDILDDYLLDGWEPYAVTMHPETRDYFHHLRRQTSRGLG